MPGALEHTGGPLSPCLPSRDCTGCSGWELGLSGIWGVPPLSPSHPHLLPPSCPLGWHLCDFQQGGQEGVQPCNVGVHGARAILGHTLPVPHTGTERGVQSAPLGHFPGVG